MKRLGFLYNITEISHVQEHVLPLYDLTMFNSEVSSAPY